MMLNQTGDINDIHLWNIKYNHPEELCQFVSICPNCVNFLPGNAHFVVFIEGGDCPPACAPLAKGLVNIMVQSTGHKLVNSS